jgi:hypothetical protein
MIYTIVTFLYKTSMTVITEDGGRQNMYSKEPEIQVIDPQDQLSRAEMMNGRWAMIGFVAAVGAYLTTGQIIPGVF